MQAHLSMLEQFQNDADFDDEDDELGDDEDEEMISLPELGASARLRSEYHSQLRMFAEGAE